MKKKFNLKNAKAINIKKSVKFIEHDPTITLRNKKVIAQALLECLLDGDKESFYEILSAHLRVINKDELSRRSKIPIATIRRVAAGSNFSMDTFLKIMAAINEAA